MAAPKSDRQSLPSAASAIQGLERIFIVLVGIERHFA
jgi:hypothetical protein